MAVIHQISSDLPPISTATLPPTQAQIIAALAKGQTITAAAREAGIHRTTIHHWLRTEPGFKAALEAAHREYVAALADEMRELSALALATLRSQLEDPATPPSIRLRAALAVLERPKFPKQGWNLPESVESPLHQQVLDDLAEVEADYKVMGMTEAVESQAAKADTPQTAPEPSGPHCTQPTTHHPPSRCAPCPCGSGLKYKRCCGSGTHAAASKTARAA